MRTRRVLNRWLLLGLALGLGGCKCESKAPSAPPPQARSAAAAVAQPPAKCVPRVLVARPGTPKLDGELDEPVWHSAAVTDPFVHRTSNRAVPHTEARAAWDAQALYVVLYVADAELHGTDRVRLEFEGGNSVEVSPAGALACRFGAQTDCAAAGVVGMFERDGDVDADAEEDEEWAAELRIPWPLLAPGGRPAALPVNFSREDTLDGKPLREVWSRGCGELQLLPASN